MVRYLQMKRSNAILAISVRRCGNAFLSLLCALLVSSCGAIKDSAPTNYTKKWHEISDAVPEKVKPSKYGNPDTYEVFGKTYYVMGSADGFEQKGIASWYGNKFHGRRTSSGEDYDMYAMTAAHKTLPIPVYVKVKNIDNGRTAIVRVNDRGPFHDGRIIDLSYAAATKLGVAQSGTANVTISVIRSVQNESNNHSQKFVNSSVSEGDKLYIQVAAFAAEENALSYKEKLQAQGFFDVRLHKDKKKGTAVYRVRIGPLPSQHVAKNVLNQLEESDHRDLKIVKNN